MTKTTDWEKDLDHLTKIAPPVPDEVLKKYDMSNSTQNDIPKWSKRLQEAYDKGYEKGLADARKEVIERIESIPEKDVRSEITVWLESKEYCLGYNEALKDVLATLKEEQI